MALLDEFARSGFLFGINENRYLLDLDGSAEYRALTSSGAGGVEEWISSLLNGLDG
jgi:hypothetical protein